MIWLLLRSSLLLLTLNSPLPWDLSFLTEVYSLTCPLSPVGLPWRLCSKESACSAGDAGDEGSIPGSGRSPGGGEGNPLQYSCLENPCVEEPDRLQSTGSQESDTTKWLNHQHHKIHNQYQILKPVAITQKINTWGCDRGEILEDSLRR